MQAFAARLKEALGFLTVVEDARHGLFGGYLVLNATGRPLEFHCTTPIKPNRAQQILYGPTLIPFLYGEQIGQTLLNKGQVEPLVVCTDRPPVLEVRPFVNVPLALVLSDGTTAPHCPPSEHPAGRPTPGESAERLRDTVHTDRDAAAGLSKLRTFQLGRNHLAVAREAEEDLQQITERIGHLADSFDLTEPFTRIREAIEEAQKAA